MAVVGGWEAICMPVVCIFFPTGEMSPSKAARSTPPLAIALSISWIY
jgi:hypothetical protein